MLRSQMFKSGISAFLVALALIPSLLFAYSGQFSRMIADDYCRIEAGLANGPWQNVAHWRSIWTGSYTNYFLHGVFAPLDLQITRMLPAATSLLWLIGLFWLLWRVFGFGGWRRHRLSAALICASLLLATMIDAFYSKQTFFHYTAHLSYASPIVLFTIYLAAILEAICRLRARRSWALAAVASLVFCFLNAGFAEMYLVAQGTALFVFLVAAYLLAEYPHRRPTLLLLSAGMFGTATSAVVMLTAPGVMLRAADSHSLVMPVRDLPELLDLSMARAVEYLTDANAFAGFALVFALGMAAAQIACRPSRADTRPLRAGVPSAPLYAGLAIQLLFVPFLWSHASDSPQFFGRFSLPYMAVVILNLALIIGYGALLWWRNRLNQQLSENQKRLAPIAGLALTVAFALFMATQLRSVHIRAEFFLYVSALVILANISVQLSRGLPQSVAKRWREVIIVCLGAALMSSFVLALIAFYAVGFVGARYMGPVAVFQISAGFAWGALVGSALGCVLRAAGPRSAIVLAFRLAPLLVVLMIGIGIVAAQIRWIPDLQFFADGWDERHQYILEQRDSGQRQIEIWPLSYDLGSEFRNVMSPRSQTYENSCAAIYYGVESIKLADS